MAHNVQFKRMFSAAHRLYDYEGKCHNIHGHNYHIEVTVMSPHLVSPGFIVDYTYVKDLIDDFDHTLILYEGDPLVPLLKQVGEEFTQVDFEPTTEALADFMAGEIYHEIVDTGGVSPWWVSVVLYETENIRAEAFHGDGPWEDQAHTVEGRSNSVNAS